MAFGRRPAGVLRRIGLVSGLVGLTVGLVLGVAAQAWPAATPAAAQARASVLTSVRPDGTLLALENESWSELPRNIGNGATVTGLAWHPTRPEVLLVRRTLARRSPIEPSYALVYLDLATGREQTIIEGVGPQAIIAGPQIAPDGKSGFARVECCLSRQIISFALPLTGEQAKQGPAGAFQDQEARAVSMVTTGAYAPDGRILMTVECCMGDDPATDPRGLYRVSADLTKGEKLTASVQGLPLGIGPGGAWVAVVEQAAPLEDVPGENRQLVIVELPSGNRRPPLGEGGMNLAEAGAVAPDGSIIVATQAISDDPWRPYERLFRFTAAGAVTPIPEVGDGVTAFALASPESVAAARKGAASALPPSSAKALAADFPHEVQVFFSKRPESDAEFTAVFPVTRQVGDAGVAYGALEELLRGPTPEEQAAGYFSEIGQMLVGPSNCRGEPFMLRLEAGTATLTFCHMVSSAGIGQDARAQAALEATLRQFSTIQRTRILTPDGDCLFDMSGENRCLNGL